MNDSLPTLTIINSWQELLGAGRAGLEVVLPAYIQPRRWFGAKARQITSAQIVETIFVIPGSAALNMVRISYAEGQPDTYVMPLAFAAVPRAEQLVDELPHAVVARVQVAGAAAGVLYDPLVDADFCTALLDLIADQSRLPGAGGELQASTTSAFARLRNPDGGPAVATEVLLTPQIVTAEQSNSSIIYGDRFILKLFRRLEIGLNPDLEIGRFLTERSHFSHVPPAAGALEYHVAGGEPSSLGILQGFVRNQGDAWHYTLATLAESFLSVAKAQSASIEMPTAPLLDLAAQEPPAAARAFIGSYLASAQLLGQRTAELHLALASDAGDPNFAPEPFAAADQAAIYESMRSRANQSFASLRRVLAAGTLPDSARAGAERVLGFEAQIFERLRLMQDRPIGAMRTRFHGDYHLGQVLYTGTDFLIIDFEGEPARPLSERRRKGSPLQDVAGMLRSFHYVSYAVLLGQSQEAVFSAEDFAILEPWARLWHRWISAAFLQSYLTTADGALFLPAPRDELAALLEVYLLDKAVYELNYELNNRPAWVPIAVEGILQLIA